MSMFLSCNNSLIRATMINSNAVFINTWCSDEADFYERSFRVPVLRPWEKPRDLCYLALPDLAKELPNAVIQELSIADGIPQSRKKHWNNVSPSAIQARFPDAHPNGFWVP